MVKVVSKAVSSSAKESADSPASGSRDVRPVLDGTSFKAGRTRAHSKFLSPRPKSNIKKRRSTLVDNNLYLADIPMEELGDLLICNRAGLILGAFLDLDKPQMTSEIYNLLILPKMVKCFFDFWLESTSHPSNVGLPVMQICKRSFNLLTILSSPQAFSENLIDENIHQIMEQVSRAIMAPSKPYIAEPSQPSDVEQNFHHLKMGVELLLKKKPSEVRRWLLSTRHAQTEHMRPPVFGLLNHLHHPGTFPLLSGLLFDLVEGLASHTAALEAFALHGFFEAIWNGVWKESRGQAWFDLLLYLLAEGGTMFEAGGLFRFLGSSDYSADIVGVFNQGSPVLCRYMIEFIESIQLFTYTPPNQDKLLSQITHDILRRNLDAVSPAFTTVESFSTIDQVKFFATFIKPIRLASRDQALTDGCNFSPVLFKVMFDLMFAKEKCSILHCLFLTLVDSLVGAIANHPNPISAVRSASYVLLDLKAASRANSIYETTSQSDEDLKLTLYLLQVSLHALYLGIKARTDPPEHVVTSLRLAIESGADLDLIRNLPQPRDPPLDLSHLPTHLSFTGAVLIPPKKIVFDFMSDDL